MRFDAPSLAVVGDMLSTQLLFILIKKQIITEAEAMQTIEDILLNLETHQQRSGPMAPAIEGARGILESLRRVISDQA